MEKITRENTEQKRYFTFLTTSPMPTQLSKELERFNDITFHMSITAGLDKTDEYAVFVYGSYPIEVEGVVIEELENIRHHMTEVYQLSNFRFDSKDI